jgi:hypothetical protein
VTSDERLKAWLAAEREAVAAELAVEQLGQGASDPRAAELCRTARQRREWADALFHQLYAAGKQGGTPEGGPGRPS